jgi:DNA-binding transcriptional ArsR family regulator
MIDRDALFRSLADPTRRAIFETLCRDGDLPVTALTRGANISQPAVSKHLGVLRDAGLVVGRQAGRQTFYHAEPETLKAVSDWMAEMRGFWERRLDKFEDLLNRMDQ